MKTESIPFKVIRKENPNLPAGQEKVVKAGVLGECTSYISTLTENGKTSETVLDSQVTKEPMDQVVEVGTLVTHVGDEHGQAAVKEEKTAQEIPSVPTPAAEEKSVLEIPGESAP